MTTTSVYKADRRHMLRWHPQTQTIALCIYRCDATGLTPAPGQHLPRLPPELWEIILRSYHTTPHVLFGTPPPLLRLPTGSRLAPLRLPPNWETLPERIRKRWKVLARYGVYLHISECPQYQLDCLAPTPSVPAPLPGWRHMTFGSLAERLVHIATASRLRPHCLSPARMAAVASAVAMPTDPSDAWRAVALMAPRLILPVAPPRELSSTDRKRIRHTSRRLDTDHTTEQTIAPPSLKPPLGLHVREGLGPPILRQLAKGLCPPDNQPPPKATTAAEIISHIFKC